MSDYADKQAQALEDRKRNEPIEEEVFEEEKSPTASKHSHKHLGAGKTPVSHQSSENPKLRFKQDSNMNLGSSSTSSSRFKSDKEWLSIEQWDSQSSQLSITYQFLLFKVKMYETFECIEDGHSNVWHCLLKFPTNKMKFFPLTKFQ